MSATIELTKDLIARASITPEDAGCQKILTDRLQKIGFEIEQFPFGEVSNFWARRGQTGPLLLFVGHTDVVPTGPIDKWTSPPFEPEIREGRLYGRGAADMKGSIAAMLVACENFIAKHPNHAGSIAWLITSDEEGPSIDGVAKVAEILKQRNTKIDYCVVGEPSSDRTLGDILKIGRRGTLSGKLKVIGKQGHIAYPQLADNPIHKILPALTEIIQVKWDNGNEFFQATSFQISNINAGTGAGNVIPGEIDIQFNFRYSPEVTAEKLKQGITEILNQHQLNYKIDWQHSGQPFITAKGRLVEATISAVEEISKITPTVSTTGGTSDGRFIAPLGAQIVELGPCNKSIHQIDENVKIEELENLTFVYLKILEKLVL